MKIKLLLLFILQSMIVNSSPFNGKVQSFKQPDGSLVDLKLFGTEYFMRAEGLDGYTLIREKQTGIICYAELSEDNSELLSTGIKYTGTISNTFTPQSIIASEKHLDIDVKSREKIIEKNKKQLSGGDEKSLKLNSVTEMLTTPINPLSGNIKGLCIVVDFSDEPGMLPMSEFEDFCNDLSYSNFNSNGSLRTYYSDISGGVLDYENYVFGYFRAPLTFADYDAMPYAVGAKQILGLALEWIDSLGFDFSTLTTNPDNSIKAINLMYTGFPPVWAEGMWHHMGSFNGFSADGVFSNAYNCSPANSPLELSVVAHENGHMICKWPDTYKYNSNNGPDGIGSFDLMCWYGSSFNPTPPNPLFSSNCGWTKTIDVTNFNGLISDTANVLSCYKYSNLNDTNEFFLLQNRTMTGRSEYIDDDGLTIWHIDRNGDNQSAHHEVYLVHANDDISDHSGACFKNGQNDIFNFNSIPSSAFYNGDPSGLHVWDVSSPDSIITYRLGTGTPGASFNLMYDQLTDDSNGNGFVEGGESANLNVTTFNNGQLPSGIATVTCEVTSANASLVTINTPPVNIGIVPDGQNISSQFNFTIDPSVQIGVQFTFRFSVSDGTDSLFILRTITTGETVTMNNTDQSVCSAIFVDPGGNGNYQDDIDLTKTISPLSTGQFISVDFSMFELEDEPNCNFDYLSIYDGPTAFSQLIGTYCGQNSPGIITSTHNTGSLTFVFHSDGALTEAGWEALISCNGSVGISDPENSTIEINPNPGTGLFRLRVNSVNAANITITDVIGKTITSGKLLPGEYSILDLSRHENGIYFVKMNSGISTTVQRIILQR